MKNIVTVEELKTCPEDQFTKGNKTFVQVGVMLTGNKYASHVVSNEGSELYRIEGWGGNVSIAIQCSTSEDRVSIIGYALQDIVYTETYAYDNSRCWKYNVIDFKDACTRAFSKATEEYVAYETLESLPIYDKGDNQINSIAYEK